MTDIHPLEWMTHETELNMSIEQIGVEVYRLAMKIEDGRNRGFSMAHFKNHNELFPNEPLCIALLYIKYTMAWENILFHADKSYNSDYSGWGVRRKPPWWMIWMDRYGEICTALVEQIISEAWDAATIEKEARRAKRKVTSVAGMDLEEMDTMTVGYYAAVFDVLSQRAMYRYMDSALSDKMAKLLRVVYQSIANDFTGEIVYRTKGEPQERSSKKKTLAARLDWQKAITLRESGIGAFFTADFVRQCVESVNEPDLSVTFDDLPKKTLKETPIVNLPDADLISEFMKLLGSGDEFEREDAQLILRTLRPMLARARGQHGTIDTTISSQDEAEV